MNDTYPSSARGIMRFHLVYNGSLKASGNSSKPNDAARIRRELAPQLAYLWDSHPALSVLNETGAVPIPGIMVLGQDSPRAMAARGSHVDCLTWLKSGAGHYMPLVRKSLDLSCELQIMFLRQQDPGDLVSQGGDIDNRIKLLLDALRMPERQEQEKSGQPDERMCCLMESDTLVSRLDIDTDRLLFPATSKPDEVHITIQVKLNVLKVGPHNTCLL